MLVFAVALGAQAPDSRTVFELLKSGASLSAANAAEFEKELQNNPSKAELRIQLLAYYASQPKDLPLEDVKAARLRHVLAVLETDPRDGLGLFRVATGVYRINCQGDDLADPKGAEQVANKWLEIVATEPNNQTFRREAVEALQYCTPEKAETLLRERADNASVSYTPGLC